MTATTSASSRELRDRAIEGWLREARAGSREAFGSALDACRPGLLRKADRMLPGRLVSKCGPEDLVQETFLAAHCHFSEFSGETAGQWRGWLLTILLNWTRTAGRRYGRAGKRSVSCEVSIDRPAGVAEGPGASLTSADGPPLERLIAAEGRALVRRALGGLRPRDRAALVLRFYGGARYGDLAARFGVSESMARKLVGTALGRLVPAFVLV